MGCCCKRKKLEEKPIPENQDPEDEEDLQEKLIDSNRQTDVNNGKLIQELPSTENSTDKNPDSNNNIQEIREPMPYEIYLKDYLDEEIDNTEIFDKKWYSDIEKDKIIYSKRTIIAMINEAYDEKNKDYKEIYNKPPLIIAIKSNGSFITDQHQITRNIFTINKNKLPKNTSLKMIFKYMLNVKERNSWDPQFKLYKVIEGTEEGTEVKCILHNWMKSPMFLVSERDIVEKRYDFYYNGKFISSESSVNDDYIPLEENVTRINDFISIHEIYEENENFILRALTQLNAKVSLPQAIINATLPGKLSDYYNGIINAINRDYNEGKLIFEDNDGNIIENDIINDNIDNVKINIDDKK